jgi:hypothetical protein
VGWPTLQGVRTARGSRSPGTARGTRSPGTRGERDHQARVGGRLFFFVLLVAIGQGSTLAIRSDLRSPGHVGRATSQWAGPLWRVRERQARERVPTGRERASLDPRRPLPSGAMACGARSSFFLSCNRWLEPWQIRRSQRGGSPDRIWTNLRGTGTIRSLATNDVTIRSETFDEEQFCKIRSTTLCSNLSNLTTARMINNQQINLAVSNPVI